MKHAVCQQSRQHLPSRIIGISCKPRKASSGNGGTRQFTLCSHQHAQVSQDASGDVINCAKATVLTEGIGWELVFNTSDHVRLCEPLDKYGNNAHIVIVAVIRENLCCYSVGRRRSASANGGHELKTFTNDTTSWNHRAGT